MVGLAVAALSMLFAPVAGAKAAVKTGSQDLSLARDYVLAACLAQRYAATPLATEANTWAAGLIEQGNLAAEAYPALARLASTAAAPGVSRDGVTMRLQSCVDLINARDFPARLRQTLDSPVNKR